MSGIIQDSYRVCREFRQWGLRSAYYIGRKEFLLGSYKACRGLNPDCSLHAHRTSVSESPDGCSRLQHAGKTSCSPACATQHVQIMRPKLYSPP